MPTITYQRVFCKTCKDFELHDYRDIKLSDDFKQDDKFLSDDHEPKRLTCFECDTVYSDITIGEIEAINKEGLILQRKRWKEKRKAEFSKLLSFGALGFPSILSDLYSEKEVGITNIIESDAGQKAIDEYERLKYKKKRQEEAEDIEKHKHLGRNDKCICESGLKFKNCCLKRINSY